MLLCAKKLEEDFVKETPTVTMNVVQGVWELKKANFVNLISGENTINVVKNIPTLITNKCLALMTHAKNPVLKTFVKIKINLIKMIIVGQEMMLLSLLFVVIIIIKII